MEDSEPSVTGATLRRAGCPAGKRRYRTGYKLVRIPGGTFLMGSPVDEKGHYEDEEPLHEVHVPDFFMGVCPVTNEQYGVFLKQNTGVSEPEYWSDAQRNQPDQAVVAVSWDDAQAFADWVGLRLPSESEWEYACRAGTQTAYWSGDDESDLARVGWYSENFGFTWHPVGQKEPNAFGLFDMHGNVFEWVEDHWHSSYQGAPADGKAWIDKEGGSDRTIRGGSWLFPALNCRSAIRSDGRPERSCGPGPGQSTAPGAPGGQWQHLGSAGITADR
jgi:formylglycine-generating enzyme required for sulfatase activity